MTTVNQKSPPVADGGILDSRARKVASNPKYASAVAKYELSEQVARLLIGYRMDHDLTQKQLGEKLDMTVPEISRLESGEHVPSGKTLDRITTKLGKRIVFADVEARELVHA